MTDSGAPGPWALWRAILSPTSPLSPSQRLALAVLVQHADGNGAGAYPSLSRIAACTGLHRATAVRAVAALVGAGLVAKERDGRRCRYAVELPAVLTLDESQTRTGRKREPVLECNLNSSRMRPQSVADENSTVPVTVPTTTPKGEAPSRRASPPTVEEVTAYLAELGERRFTAEAFCDYYGARGWRTKAGPIRDWRACVRTWRRVEGSNAGRTAPRQRTGREVVGVESIPAGKCAECGRPSRLTICEFCQREHFGRVELTEENFAVGAVS